MSHDDENNLPDGLRRAWQTGRVFDDRRNQDDRRQDDANSWRPVLIGGLWVVLLMVAGWMATDSAEARKLMASQISANTQRITILEAESRFSRETLQRIEAAGEENRKMLHQLLREGQR